MLHELNKRETIQLPCFHKQFSILSYTNVWEIVEIRGYRGKFACPPTLVLAVAQWLLVKPGGDCGCDPETYRAFVSASFEDFPRASCAVTNYLFENERPNG